MEEERKRLEIIRAKQREEDRKKREIENKKKEEARIK